MLEPEHGGVSTNDGTFGGLTIILFVAQCSTYLLYCAANRPIAPFCSTEVNELLSQLRIRIVGEVIINARQLLAEEALLAALAAKCASSGLVFWSIRGGARQRRYEYRRGDSKQRCDSDVMTHLVSCQQALSAAPWVGGKRMAWIRQVSMLGT